MEKECRKGNKLNNKGFSLVEIIIVIAIMAILAGALAPQLIKYIEKSRVSSDISNCNSLKTAVQTALADEKAYESAIASSEFIFNGSEPVDSELADGNFKTELNTIIGEWPKVKAKNAANFKVSLDANKNVKVVTVKADGTVITY